MELRPPYYYNRQVVKKSFSSDTYHIRLDNHSIDRETEKVWEVIRATEARRAGGRPYLYIFHDIAPPDEVLVYLKLCGNTVVDDDCFEVEWE